MGKSCPFPVQTIMFHYFYTQCYLKSPPQQNFRQLFFTFRKVWGYPTALISWFINFKTSRLRDCAYSFFKQISKISDKNLPDDEMKALKNLIENKIINA